jgi:hypothetical protein
MNKPNLAEIRGRCEAATAGPWKVNWEEDDNSLEVNIDNKEGTIIGGLCMQFYPDYSPPSENDAAFIAAARTDIPALLEYIGELEAALDKCAIGGNHLPSIFGIPHPLINATWDEVCEFYKDDFIKYEAWCCWKAIRDATAILPEE